MKNEFDTFIRSLADKLRNRKDCIAYCRSKQTTESADINIISTLILGVYQEIDDYFDIFLDKVEKSYGIPSRDEWVRIIQEVIDPFIEYITESTEPFDVLSSIKPGLNSLIFNWRNIPKEAGWD